MASTLGLERIMAIIFSTPDDGLSPDRPSRSRVTGSADPSGAPRGKPGEENRGWDVQNRVAAPTRGRAPARGDGTEGPRHEVHDHDVRRYWRRHAEPLAGVDRRHARAADEARYGVEGIG